MEIYHDSRLYRIALFIYPSAAAGRTKNIINDEIIAEIMSNETRLRILFVYRFKIFVTRNRYSRRKTQNYRIAPT